MFLDPSQITVAQLSLMSQLEELQGLGYLSQTTLNFGHELENTLVSAYRGLTGNDRSSLPPAARLWSRDDYQSRLRQVLEGSIRFRPNVASDFKPLQGIVLRGCLKKPFPVVIEKVSYEQAEDIARFSKGRRHLKEFEIFKGHESIEPMVFLMRDWGGQVHAMAIALLHPQGDTKMMLCCRDVKFDRNKNTAFRGVGPVLTLARLLYMKKAGYWTDEAPILRDIYPEVLASYRSRFPTPRSMLVRLGEWHIERAEGDHMISHSPFDLVELPVSPLS